MGGIPDDDGLMPLNTITSDYEETETVEVVPERTVIHRFRDVHKGYSRGNFIRPNAYRQTEKLMQCCICPAQEWVAINTNWTSHPQGSIYSQPYLGKRISRIRPGQFDSGAGWSTTGIDLLKAILVYCPEHAALAAPHDQEIRAGIGGLMLRMTGDEHVRNILLTGPR